jgi:hypothetical protein
MKSIHKKILQKHLPDFEQFIAQVRSHESLDGEGP